MGLFTGLAWCVLLISVQELKSQEFNRSGVSEEARSSRGQLFRRTGVLRPAVQEAKSS